MNRRRPVLKVTQPYAGTAFLAAPGIAVSCWHVCAPDSPHLVSPVVFEYCSENTAQCKIAFRGQLLHAQSDPKHDLAVVQVDIPDEFSIPPAPLSLDDDSGEPVVAMGFPDEQFDLEEVEGVIFPHHPVKQIWFEAETTPLEVLRIDTRAVGFYRDGDVRSGMSGGPVWNDISDTVVAVVVGKKPRGLLPHSPPDGYAIRLTHLIECSPDVRSHVRQRRMNYEETWRLVEKAGQLGKRDRVIERVVRRMATTDSHQRYWCYVALGRIGGKDAELIVANGLVDEDDFARMGAEEAWKLLGH